MCTWLILCPSSLQFLINVKQWYRWALVTPVFWARGRPPFPEIGMYIYRIKPHSNSFQLSQKIISSSNTERCKASKIQKVLTLAFNNSQPITYESNHHHNHHHYHYHHHRWHHHHYHENHRQLCHGHHDHNVKLIQNHLHNVNVQITPNYLRN